jgi:hypothetical protein
MKRSTIALVVLCIAAAAQQPGQPILDTYRAWRANHPDLERDSTKGEPNFESRVEKSSTDQAKYAAVRKEMLEAMRDEARQQLSRADSLELRVPGEQDPAVLDSVVNAMNTANSASRDATSGTDRGLRALRQAIEHEGAALKTLTDGIASRRKLEAGLAEATNTAEVARDNVRQKYGSIASGFDQEAQQVARQQIAWTEYYRLLNPTARRSVTQNTTSSVASASGRINAPRVNDPAPGAATPSPSVTPVPLARYTGEWQYSRAVRVFQGLEPETAELMVHEQNGQVDGSLNVRFKAGPSVPTDRDVHFNFAGSLQTTRNQVFLIQNTTGDKGAIELIPGTAFNLLQVKFGLDERPGKISSADFVLLKK